MSVSPKTRSFRCVALTMTAFVALASSGVAAMAKSDHKSAETRAAHTHHAEDRCVPANGAQIMGGFAGADDRIDSVTGEICRK